MIHITGLIKSVSFRFFYFFRILYQTITNRPNFTRVTPPDLTRSYLFSEMEPNFVGFEVKIAPN